MYHPHVLKWLRKGGYSFADIHSKNFEATFNNLFENIQKFTENLSKLLEFFQSKSGNAASYVEIL